MNNNMANRCVQHHVMGLELLRSALQKAGWGPPGMDRFPPLLLGAPARTDAQ
jgi:hypothetical protein